MKSVEGIIRTFRERFADEPQVFSAPGRVNLIGEHTDYNEGFVLPFAIQQRTFAACVPRSDRWINVYTKTLDKEAKFSLDEPPHLPKKEWSRYIRGIAASLGRHGVELKGANLVVDSEIPFGAGLSSSAALEVCTGLALWTLSENCPDLREIAFAGQNAEHEFIGVRSGLMDQLTSALGRRENVLLIDCRTNSIEYIPLRLDGLLLAICDTRVKHELAASAYNQRRDECEKGVDLLARYLGEIRSLRDVSIRDLEDHESVLPDPLRRRCRHIVTENQRVLETAAAIKRNDMAAVGRLMYQSHDSLRDDFEVSSPELDNLVDTASRLTGVLGARMTGGGFGGCTINLIESDLYPEFQRSMKKRFFKVFGREPDISTVLPSDGARQE